MFCGKCGKTIEPGHSFCGACGAKVYFPGAEYTADIPDIKNEIRNGDRIVFNKTGIIVSVAAIIFLLIVICIVLLRGNISHGDAIDGGTENIAAQESAETYEVKKDNTDIQADGANTDLNGEQDGPSQIKDAKNDGSNSDSEQGDILEKDSSEDKNGMKDPLDNKDIYKQKYEKIVGDFWDIPANSGWSLTGVEIVKFNGEIDDVPEILTLWSTEDGTICQTIFGVQCDSKNNTITSSTVDEYNLKIYMGDDGSTLAYTVNDKGSVFLVDSTGYRPFSMVLGEDPEYDYSVRGDYIGRVPDIFERAKNSPAKWSPDGSQYYKIYSKERDQIAEALIEDREEKTHKYCKCNIKYSESGEEKDKDWQKIWDEAWELYEQYWD